MRRTTRLPRRNMRSTPLRTMSNSIGSTSSTIPSWRLARGGKVFTMLDTSYVYMDIYLPTADAGRVRLGSEARIVLDAYSDHVIPAKVVFIASQAQFTPK